jgi:predicted transcriptional regulator
VGSLVLGFVAEPTVASAVEPAVGTRFSFAAGFALVTVASMVIGELIPKNVAIARAERMSMALARPVLVYAAVFGPVFRVLNRAANTTVGRLGIEPQEELGSVRTLEELELLIRSSGEHGTLDPEAFTLLTRTLRFNDKTAADALVPRVDVAFVHPDDNIQTLIGRAVEMGFSRFPVCGTDLDDVVGVVHVKDVCRVPPERRTDDTVADVMKEAFVVPETRDLASLLLELGIGFLNHLFMAGAIAQDRESCQFPFVLDEKPTVVSVGSAGERSGGARKVPCGAARSNSGRAAPSACVGKRFSAAQIIWNRSTRRTGARGGAQVDRPRWLRILTITGGSSMAAMIFKALPQFGQCSMSISKTRLSSRAQLMRGVSPWAAP